MAIAPRTASHGPADRHSLPELPAAAGAPPLPIGRAAFSRCGRYRWWLARLWRPRAARLVFLGLNPSRADARRDDATLRRLLGFARAWDYGGLEVLNLFARVSASPAALRRCGDPVGPRCDAWIQGRLRRLAAHEAPVTLWLGWGNGGGWRERDVAVLALVSAAGWRPLCLGRTASGHPRHPLYLPRGGRLAPFAPSWAQRSVPSSPPSPCPESRVVMRST